MNKPSNSVTNQLDRLRDAFQKFYYIGLVAEQLQSSDEQRPAVFNDLMIQQLSIREAILQQQITEMASLLNEVLAVRDVE